MKYIILTLLLFLQSADKYSYTSGVKYLIGIEIKEPGYDGSFIKVFDAKTTTDTSNFILHARTDIYNWKGNKGKWEKPKSEYIPLNVKLEYGCLIKFYGKHPGTIKADFK
jgi:hypothetical protein